jgi:hypothetical protein
MSALCLSVMQLLANPGDRVTHVLVGGGFDQANNGFFFPTQRQQVLAGPAGPLRACDAAGKIQLIDVPVIPLRRWFEDLLQVKPPSHDVLLPQGAAALQSIQTADLRLALGPVVLSAGTKSKHFIELSGVRVALSPDQFAYLRFFAERLVAGDPPFEKAIDAVESMVEWLKRMRSNEPRFHRMSEAFDAGTFNGESLIKRLSDLRAFVATSCESGRRLAAVLPGNGRWALQLPRESVELRD